MATISDVAERAKVSKTLVSRVLNNRTGVGEASRKRILEAIKELNYRPNELARSLVLQKTQTIGIVIDTLCIPYYFDLIKGFEEGGDEEDYNIIFCSGRSDPIIKSKYINFFTHHRVDGLVIYGSLFSDEGIIRDLAAAGFPFVLIENEIPNLEINNILIDNFGGAYKATEHLIKLGYKKIFHFSGDMNTKVSTERLNGYIRAMQDYGIPMDKDSIIYTQFKEKSGYGNMKHLLKRQTLPDAIFFAADISAFGAIRAITEAGLTVPGDIAITGFDDDIPDSRDIIFPGLTTMKQPLREIGHQSIKLLTRSINNPYSKPLSKTYKTELIIRESCGANKT